MSEELVDPKEYGIDTVTHQELTNGLEVTRAERALLDEQFEVVSKLEITPDNIEKFKELRLAYVKNRTRGVDVWHKTQKEIPLRMGQFLDAIKKSEYQKIKSREDVLIEAEKFFENQEIERIKKLEAERVAELLPYDPRAELQELGKMSEEMYQAWFNTRKEMWEKAEADRIKLEEERLAELKAREEESERIRIENDRLKKEAEASRLIRDARSKELQPYIVFIRDYNGLIESDEKSYQKQLADIKKGAELQWESDRKEAEKVAGEIHDRKCKAIEFAKENGYQQLNEYWLQFREHLIESKHFDNLKSDEELEVFKKGITTYVEKFKRQDEIDSRADQAIKFLIGLKFSDLNDKWSDGLITVFTTEFDRFESDSELENFKSSVTDRIKSAKAQAELDKIKAAEAKTASENLSKGDAQKMADLLADLNALKTKYKFESPDFVKKYGAVCQLIDKIVVWAKK